MQQPGGFGSDSIPAPQASQPIRNPATAPSTLARLHSGLRLGGTDADGKDNVDIKLLAEQLQQQLGTVRSRALGKLLAGNN